jgi:ribonuclease HII
VPDFSYEDNHSGLVAGLDEVGRGCLIGAVVAAAVVIPDAVRPEPWVQEIRDSKKLKPSKREQLARLIHEHCICGIGQASAAEIDTLNIQQATFLAMQRALAVLPASPVHILVDGNRLPPLSIPATAIIQGDNLSITIAAASIIAKVERDRQMQELDTLYPRYGLAQHKGYPTVKHREAVNQYGLTPHHRKSFMKMQHHFTCL